MSETERLALHLEDMARHFTLMLADVEDEDTAKVLRSLRQRVVSLARLLQERERSPEWQARLRELAAPTRRIAKQ